MKQMMTVKTKQWGNSLGVILPAEKVRELSLSTDEFVNITVEKRVNPLKGLFGSSKGKRLSTKDLQETKQMFEL